MMFRKENFQITDNIILGLWELAAPESILLQLLRELEGDREIKFWGSGTITVPEPRNNQVYLFRIDLKEERIELIGTKEFL